MADHPAETQQRLHVLVHGRVQGVSFRAYTVDEANRLGVVGWVRNLPDRTVEVMAEGSTRQLQQLLTWLYRGSPAAHVTQVEANWYPAVGDFTAFTLRH